MCLTSDSKTRTTTIVNCCCQFHKKVGKDCTFHDSNISDDGNNLIKYYTALFFLLVC